MRYSSPVSATTVNSSVRIQHAHNCITIICHSIIDIDNRITVVYATSSISTATLFEGYDCITIVPDRCYQHITITQYSILNFWINSELLIIKLIRVLLLTIFWFRLTMAVLLLWIPYTRALLLFLIFFVFFTIALLIVRQQYNNELLKFWSNITMNYWSSWLNSPY